MKKIIAFLTILGLAGYLAAAEDQTDNGKDFNPNEFGISVFGSLSDEALGDVNEDYGAGVGVSYFPMQKYLGLQANTVFRNFEGYFMDNVGVDLVLRYPVENLRLAPYVVGGGAYRFGPEDWDVSVGPGLEYRFTSKWGVFGEYRYHFERDTFAEQVNEARFGLKVLF